MEDMEKLPYLNSVHGKHLCLTVDERIGVCSRETRKGDVIVSLFGSNLAFVLRPLEGKEGCWRFIGECYVHGRVSKDYLVKILGLGAELEIFNMI